MTTDRPTPKLRWIERGLNRVLQQCFEVVDMVEGKPQNLRLEWRDVPTATE